MMKSISNILEKLEKQSALEKLRKVNITPENRMLAITKEINYTPLQFFLGYVVAFVIAYFTAVHVEKRRR